MGGKKRSSVSPSQVQRQIDPLQQSAANIANQLFGQTDPLRQNITGQFNELFGGTRAQPTTPQFPPQFQFPGFGGFSGFQLPAQFQTPVIQTPVTDSGPNIVEQFSDVGTTADQFVPNLTVIPGEVGQVPTVGDADPNVINALAEQLTVDPDTPALFGGAKAAAENQFDIAQEQALSLLPTGGSLNAGLIDLEGQRAFGLSQILANLAAQEAGAGERGLDRAIGINAADLLREERGIDRQLGVDETAIDRLLGAEERGVDRGIGLAGAQIDIDQRNIDRALSLASGGATSALQGFNIGGNLAATSAATQASIANANAQRNADKKGGTGELIGTLGGSKILANCWVAREIYGANNPKWQVFRHWMLNVGPGWFRALYLRHGERFANWIRDKHYVKEIIRHQMDSRVEKLYA